MLVAIVIQVPVHLQCYGTYGQGLQLGTGGVVYMKSAQTIFSGAVDQVYKRYTV